MSVSATQLAAFVSQIERQLGRDAIIPNARAGEAYLRCSCSPDWRVWPVKATVEHLRVVAVCRRCGRRSS